MPHTGHFAQQDDVLAPEYAARPVQQRPQPLCGLDAGVEEFRLDRVGVAVGAVDVQVVRPASRDGARQRQWAVICRA